MSRKDFLLLIGVAVNLLFVCSCSHNPRTRTVEIMAPEKKSIEVIDATSIIPMSHYFERRHSLVPTSPSLLASPWRPLKHFGPFRHGSDLSKIQVWIHGPNVHLYYNDFFAGVDPSAKEIYKIYYNPDMRNAPTNVVLPTDSTPALTHVPGGFFSPSGPSISPSPSTSHTVNNLLLSLEKIAYSSKMGGSLALHFKLADIHTQVEDARHPEDFEYEFQDDEYRFDVGRLGMTVYVQPKASLFNPKQNHNYATGIGVEFTPEEVVAWKDNRIVDSPEVQDRLTTLLAEVAKDIGSKLMTTVKPGISLFTHAWIHDQHQGKIGQNDKVTKLLMSDDFIDLYTEQYEPYLYVSWRISSLMRDPVFGEFSNEFRVNVKVEHLYPQVSGDNGRPAYMTMLTDHFPLEEEEHSRWITAFGGKVEEALDDALNHIRIKVKLVEKDPFWNDIYEQNIIDLFPDDQRIQDRASQSYYAGNITYGLAAPPDREGDVYYYDLLNDSTGGWERIYEGDKVVGGFSWEAVIAMVAR
ncbi:MAG: hypothetical protein P8Z79_23485 [Sedimentisphaerales bacterium]